MTDKKKISKTTLFQPQLIEDAGFAAEEHTVVTEDGYHLTIHRLL